MILGSSWWPPRRWHCSVPLCTQPFSCGFRRPQPRSLRLGCKHFTSLGVPYPSPQVPLWSTQSHTSEVVRCVEVSSKHSGSLFLVSLSLSLLGYDVRGRSTPFLGKQSSLCSYVRIQWQNVIQKETPRLAVFLCSERLPGTDLQTHHPDHSWTPWADPEWRLFLVEFFCRFSYHALTASLLKTASCWLSLP